jgi:hypothetical protein
MAYRVSLVLDGDASGAAKAAKDAKAAVDDLAGSVKAEAAAEQANASATSAAASTHQRASAAANAYGAANANVAGSVKLNAFQVQNLSYQINDLAQVLATGQSPFRAILQQGSQIVQIFGPGVGVRGALAAIGPAIAEFLLNPLTLATVGFAAAAQGAAFLFSMINGSSGTIEGHLKEHKDLVDRITKAYGEAGKAAQGYGVDSQAALQRPAQKDQEVSAADYQSALSKVAIQIRSLTFAGPNEGPIAVFGSLTQDAVNFEKAVEAGNADLGTFRTRINAIAVDTSQPRGLRQYADQLLTLTADANDLAGKLQIAEKNLEIVEAHSPKFARTLEGTVLSIQGNQLAAQLSDLATQRAASLQGINARSPAERAAAASASVLAQPLNIGESPQVQNFQAATAGALAYANAMHSLALAQEERNRSLDETIRSSQLDLDLIGKGVGAAAALRLQYQLTAAVEADAARNGVSVDRAELARIAEKAAAYGILTQKIAEAQKLSDLQFAGSQLTRSATEQTVASTLRDIYGDNWQQELNGAIAGQIRLKATVQAGRDAWTDFGGQAFDALQDILDGSESAGDVVKKLISSLLLAEARSTFLNALVPGSAAPGPLSAIFSLFGAGGSAAATGAPMSILPPGLAGGGDVRGHGTPTSDSILARLSNGEFVVNAAAASRHRSLLHAINDNRTVPGFADGGPIDISPPRFTASGGASSGDAIFQISVAPRAGASNADIAAAGATAIKQALDDYDRRLPDRLANIGRNPRRR